MHAALPSLRDASSHPHHPTLAQPHGDARAGAHRFPGRRGAALAALAAMLVTVAMAPVADARRSEPDQSEHSGHGDHGIAGMSPLVQRVRNATGRFLDINVALGEHWVVGTPCVSGPQTGAMGVHLIQPSRLGDGTIKADEPEALIYEPLPDGSMRLVGVEFIVMATEWADKLATLGPPKVDGHLMNYVGEPNRYGLAAFYELHVWAWERNPQGNFADWNTNVTCDAQPAT